MLLRPSTKMLDFHTFFHVKVHAASLKLAHGVPAVGHGILLYVCPHQRVQLDPGILAVGHGTFWCLQLRAYWCSPMESLPVVTAGTEESCLYAAYGVCLPYGGIVSFKDAARDIEADRSSFPL